ncbi:MAG: succinylglutamate desuccinylase/aspartoacylase family protein [Saprospiraceae bacterium]|nr:succinylglutamate desuccinylase/aspartoacylase family protein [Saprospiraceae bacterium]
MLGKHIAQGSYEVMNLHVGQLPSATKLYLKTHIFCGTKPGPTMLLLAGMHGDEINGIEIVRRALDQKIFDHVVAGNVIVIPILNIYGFINFSRHVPDGKDVNRSFPGTSRGSLASRVAHLLTKNVLPIIDFGIDLHTGGDNRFNFPQVRFNRRDDQARQLAEQFNAPIMIEKGLIPKSLRKVARDMKVPIIVYEGGESLRLDGYVIDEALRGIKRVMLMNGMTTEEVHEKKSSLYAKTSWIRASTSGLFIWSQKSGTQVRKGEPLGSIFDPQGRSRSAVLATRDSFIIGHNNTPVVHKGDALFHLAYNSSK